MSIESATSVLTEKHDTKQALAKDKQPGQDRYVFIDALRGLAALGVLGHHMLHNAIMEQPLRRILPSFMQTVMGFIGSGVFIFFVLSGFVIAHSLREVPLNGRGLGNFMLRRQLRLDPPYWAVLGISLLQHRIQLMIPAMHAEPMPPLLTVLQNMFYVQGMGINFWENKSAHSILPVAWTLCIEVQFYLVFILLLWLGHQFSRQHETRHDDGEPEDTGNRPSETGNPRSYTVAAVLIFTLGLASLYLRYHIWRNPWFLLYWCHFAAGVLAYWSVRGVINRRFFWGFMAPYLVVTLLVHNEDMVVGGTMALLLYGVGCRGRLKEWLNTPVLQYFGRISYSLYLIHLGVLSVVLRIGYRLTGEREVPALGWTLLAACLSIGAAHCVHQWIERPSMQLAARFKPESVPPSSPSGLASEASA